MGDFIIWALALVKRRPGQMSRRRELAYTALGSAIGIAVVFAVVAGISWSAR